MTVVFPKNKAGAHIPSLETALSLLRRMQDFKLTPDAITLTTLITVCLKSKQLNYTLRAYDLVKSELMQNRALHLEKETYYQIVSVCSKEGQWQRSIGILEDMERAGHAPSIRFYNSILRSFDPSRDVLISPEHNLLSDHSSSRTHSSLG